jgi:short-subunit dehydrogenase
VRPGGVLGSDTVFAREEMEINALGLMRLAQAFGPGMASRTADGTNNSRRCLRQHPVGACAVRRSRYGAFSASQAAARSISQTLRAEFSLPVCG